MQINNIFIIALLFILGTIFGSFGGVLISRKWNKKGIKSIFFGRSKCDNCNKILGFTELIPVFSFLFQKGRCKSCGTKLSNFYWIVELLMGIMFVATYLFFPYLNLGELVFWLILNWALILLLIFDIQKYELHMYIWVFVSILALFFSFWKLDFIVVLEVALAYVGIFLTIYVFSKYYVKLRFKKNAEGFGQGDIYLSLTIGALSGFIFYYNNIGFSIVGLIDLLLVYVVLSSSIGLIYAMVLKIFTEGHRQIIPFLPPMIVAFWILLLYGNYFINILR